MQPDVCDSQRPRLRQAATRDRALVLDSHCEDGQAKLRVR